MTTIQIGWTKSDRSSANYVSFIDGYRQGADQHVETITVYTDPNQTVEEIAESVFTATNAPFVTNGLSFAIQCALKDTGYNGEGAHYSLSVGDTVTVDGVTVACQSFGWERVAA